MRQQKQEAPENGILRQALARLAGEFAQLDLTFHEFAAHGLTYLQSFWPGKPDEDVLVCVYQGDGIREPFHRQDFFYLNYAYHNSYAALRDQQGNTVNIREGECCLGQPFSGYGLRAVPGAPCTIIGLLLRKEAFFRDFAANFASDNALFHFFLDPQRDRFSDAFIHIRPGKGSALETLLQVMVVEYARRGEDTQSILKPLANAAVLLLARQYRSERPRPPAGNSLVSQLVEYMGSHAAALSLQGMAARFGYHPNYISTLLHRETGKTFSRLVLEKRMERAALLMRGTDLTNEEIAATLGYSNTSNFYKAFRAFYHTTPRAYLARFRPQ